MNQMIISPGRKLALKMPEKGTFNKGTTNCTYEENEDVVGAAPTGDAPTTS